MNRSIYMLWLGDEEMNEERRSAIKNIPGATLITKKNLNDFILKDYPLHPAYDYLSTIHKSDYIRCYMMHHYGGGYSDVKPRNIDWDNAFDKMEKNSDIMMMGIATHYGHTVAGVEDWSIETRDEIIQKIPSLFCMGWFICRAYSPITTEWYTELNSRLDKFLPDLIKNPASRTRECYHPNIRVALEKPIWEGRTPFISNYPISWNILLSQILYPLQIKYIDAINNKL